jgi:hypothetical protein
MIHLDGIDPKVCQSPSIALPKSGVIWVRENSHVVSAVQHRRRRQQNPSPCASRTIGIQQPDTQLLLLQGAGPRLGVASAIAQGCTNAGPGSHPEVIRPGASLGARLSSTSQPGIPRHSICLRMEARHAWC